MALCASGEMSLGGSTEGRSVNLELGRASTNCIQMGESDVRTLADRPTGAICMENFYGKSSAPPTLGDSYCGGFYIGTTCANSTEYYLIVAPNATGCALCQWKTTRTATDGTTSRTDGFSNTYGPMDNEDHPAGNWTATRTINGFSDWYMPAIDELNVLYVNDGGSTNTTLPADEGFDGVDYWSSTEGSSISACRYSFGSGVQGISSKLFSRSVRAVRRKPV
jgi:hypothetical protein